MNEITCLFDNKMNEECGVFGIFAVSNAAEYIYYGLHALQHRGQEGAGIVTYGKDFQVYKGEGLVHNIFSSDTLAKFSGNCGIGHVRYSTTGGNNLLNVQPFLFRSYDESFALAHNGNLVNAEELKRDLEKKGSIFQTTSDSEIVAHLIKRETGTFMEKLKKSLQQLEGAFAFLFLKENELYVALDNKAMRPLSLASINGGYVVASESCAFNVIGAKFIRDIQPAEIVKISDQGIETDFYALEAGRSICAMEYIYFARPDSDIEGINVHLSRKNAGKILAKQAVIEADIVVGVPDSGLSGASGYAEASGIPLEMGLVKNKYSGRTFIQPTTILREVGVKMKLSAVPSIIKDKRVILVDDSIVRGTTSKRIVQMLKSAGAKEVHLRILAPEIKYPCFYGVDFSTIDELISGHKTVSDLCEYISADSLAFISLDNLHRAIGSSGMCCACFDKKYPTKLYSNKKSLEVK
ncbi:MAG: amidophosphoribosyltransferase [Erysipelotrichaceae bacterium]